MTYCKIPLSRLAALLGSALAVVALAPSAAAQRVPPELLQQSGKAPVDTTPVADEKNRVVVGAMVPIPEVGEGAPLFTSGDLKQMHSEAQMQAAKVASDLRRCSPYAIPKPYRPGGADIVNLVAGEKEYLARVVAASGKAETATERAEAARRAAHDGSGAMEQVIALELKRQEAVNALQKARAELLEMQAKIGDFQEGTISGRRVDWLDLQMNALNRSRADIGLGIAKPQEFLGLDIVEVSAQRFKDDGGGAPFVRVTGKIRNSSAGEIKTPALSVAVVDERGWVVANQMLTPTQKKGVPPNDTQSFQVDVRPAPDLLKSAVVTFAPKNGPPPRIGVGYFCE